MATNFGKGNRAIAFNPTSAFPLDARTYFESYSEALAKAQTAEEVGSTNTQYHYGMKLLVKDGNTFIWYKIVKGAPYLEAESTGGSSSGGNGEGGYDGDTGFIDYTTVWQINDVPDVSSLPLLPALAYMISFTSNNTSYIGIYGMYLDTVSTKTALRYLTGDAELGFSHIVAWSKSTGWANEEYKTITIHEEITDEGLLSWLTINATLISGSVEGIITRDPDRTAELPTIRFVGFSTDTGSFYAPNEWYFTVEIGGSGRLRIGDYLELCAMRTCKRPQSDKNAGYKRQRLRCLNRQLIKDTSKKYITLVVTSDEETQLFKNDRNAVVEGGCRSNIYLRLKRPFFDENGYENSAKFSNTISLQKSYMFGERHLSIK